MMELILVGAFVLGFILNLLNISGGAVLLILSGGILAMIYFYISVVLFNSIPYRLALKKDGYAGISKLRIVGSIATGIALSILVIGFLFVMLHWPGGAGMLLIGIISCVVLMAIALYKYFTKRGNFYSILIRRLTLWIAAGVLLYTLPQHLLLDIKYRNHPAYRDAVIYLIDHPDDEAARQKVEEEERKMHEAE